jgi:two-component system, cell cycle sensor histidine kinase and response regulator CckA
VDQETARQSSPDTSVGQVPMDRLRGIFDGMFDGVWLVGADGRTTYSNSAMAGLLGSTPAAMRDRSIHDFLDESAWAEIDGFLQRQRTVTGERIEIQFRRADGGELDGLVAGSPITTLDGTFAGTMLNISDVTGKRKFDAQRSQIQRLEAIGEFAGAIAHDFNNLLTAIRGHAELARTELSEDDQTRLDLDQVILNADRASGITRKLLAFTRRQVLEPIVLDPAQVIADLVPMLQPMLGEDIDLVMRVDPGHGWVRVDPVQLEQVIVNLAVNARDAMPAGGTLSIAIQNLKPSDKARPDATSTDGAYVRITVADTGTGMDEQTTARIFDPFFTTKDAGKGTGLGLATVFGIVAQSDGRIQVSSSPGKGAIFTIDLPLVDPATASAVVHARPVPPVIGSGVVLLAEDEPAVRDFAQRALEAAGYTVLIAANADEALRASGRWGEQIDVLLTDVVMPGMHGPELAFLMREQRPSIGIVYTSGYAEDAVARGGEFATPGAFLPKPFTADTLTRAVARASAAAHEESVPRETN